MNSKKYNQVLNSKKLQLRSFDMGNTVLSFDAPAGIAGSMALGTSLDEKRINQTIFTS